MKLNELAQILEDGRMLLTWKKVTLGFDGFIDSIVRIKKQESPDSGSKHMDEMREFGNYILLKGGKSFALGLEEVTKKVGGNVPIMATALSSFDLQIHCIASLGFPNLNPIFEPLAGKATVHSYANPGSGIAVEFKSGKMLLGIMDELTSVTWQMLRDRIGFDTLVRTFTNGDVIALLNWTELDYCSDIWKGILKDVLPKAMFKQKPLFFFDLGDCSSKSKSSILEALNLIKDFGRYGNVTLSVNQNECETLYALFFPKVSSRNLHDSGSDLYGKLDVNCLVIHTREKAMAWQTNEFSDCDSFLCNDPKLLTGAGDNFNAGFCLGHLLELSLANSLLLAHATSGCYIRSGKSPDAGELIHFLKQQKSD
jgi:hypothetical protein